ncbi:MAG: amidohydrolase family protein [Pseudomonadales bacterium]
MHETSVIDCDMHVLEPATLWLDYLEPGFRSRAIRIERNALGEEQLIIGDKVVLERGLAGLGGVHRNRAELFSGKLTYAQGSPPAAYDPAARQTLLDEWNVRASVTFPTIGILPFPTDDQALASAYCRAYNTWLAEFAQSVPGRIIPIATVNWFDVESAILELDRCLRLGFRGLFVPPETIGGRSPSHPDFNPLWQRLTDAGLPGCLHVIVRFSGAASPFAAWREAQPAPGTLFGFGLGATGQLMPAIAAMVLDGFFDRFPRQKLVAVEAGCGFAAYLMDRMDEKWRVMSSLGNPLAMPPGDYIRRNCYFVAEPEERTIGAMLDLVGEDNILWGSDFPHIDASMDAPEQIRASLSTLSPERQRRVLGENAASVFRCS